MNKLSLDILGWVFISIMLGLLAGGLAAAVMDAPKPQTLLCAVGDQPVHGVLDVVKMKYDSTGNHLYVKTKKGEQIIISLYDGEFCVLGELDVPK